MIKNDGTLRNSVAGYQDKWLEFKQIQFQTTAPSYKSIGNANSELVKSYFEKIIQNDFSPNPSLSNRVVA